MGHLILLIENNPISLKLESFLLEVAGYSVVKTNHNDLKKLLNSGLSRPDLILVNIQTPGIDGLGIIRMIKSNSLVCHVPILLLAPTGADVSDFLTAGCNGCLTTPIEYRGFLTAINQQLSLS